MFPAINIYSVVFGKTQRHPKHRKHSQAFYWAILQSVERQEPVRTQSLAKLLGSLFVKVLKRPGMYHTSTPQKVLPIFQYCQMFYRPSSYIHSTLKPRATYSKQTASDPLQGKLHRRTNFSYHSNMALGLADIALVLITDDGFALDAIRWQVDECVYEHIALLERKRSQTHVLYGEPPRNASTFVAPVIFLQYSLWR